MIGRNSSNTPRSTAVFEVKKKHSWRGRLLKVFEIALIAIVLFGTVVWLLIQSHFSVNNFVRQISEKLRPEVSTPNTRELKSAKDALRKSIESQKAFEIETISEVTEGYEVRLKHNAIVIFSNLKDFGQQVTTLQTLLAKAKIDNKTIKKVDFRFEKIVVQY